MISFIFESIASSPPGRVVRLRQKRRKKISNGFYGHVCHSLKSSDPSDTFRYFICIVNRRLVQRNDSSATKTMKSVEKKNTFAVQKKATLNNFLRHKKFIFTLDMRPEDDDEEVNDLLYLQQIFSLPFM